MVRFQIVLTKEAFRALRILAVQECRDTRMQAAMLVKGALERRGLYSKPQDIPIEKETSNVSEEIAT